MTQLHDRLLSDPRVSAAVECGGNHNGADTCTDFVEHLWWIAQQPDHYGVRHRQFRRAILDAVAAGYAKALRDAAEKNCHLFLCGGADLLAELEAETKE